MPDNEVVEKFDFAGHQWTIEGRDGRYYLVDDANARVGPFATAEEAKASIMDPEADNGAPVEEAGEDAGEDTGEPEGPQEPEAA